MTLRPPASRAAPELGATAAPESVDAAKPQPSARRFASYVTVAGFALYAIFAPHSIAGAEIALGIAGVGMLLRLLFGPPLSLRRTPLDLPLFLFVGWTVISSLLSAEPRISVPKLQSVCVVLLLYMTRAALARRTVLPLVVLMIASGAAGALWSAAQVALGRGVVVAEITPDSPFRLLGMWAGETVWRVGGERVDSVAEIDEAIKRARVGAPLAVSVIARGEHGERPGFVVTEEMKTRAAPSGLVGAGRTHRFRASGWTRHYETFSETLQMLAQLALGLALANLAGADARRRRWRTGSALAAALILAVGVGLTAMRTVLIALACGALIVAWRAARLRTNRVRRVRLAVTGALAIVVAFGAFVVWRTRADNALRLSDPSANLRLSVARVAFDRVWLRPVFGHGMDAVKLHWAEWGFPGTDMLHAHSTPLQIAFDRGLPALLLWLWLMWACWRAAAQAEERARTSPDRNGHGLLLGATGAVAGFFASSLVNYNFGDAEVALAFWWLVGAVAVCSEDRATTNTRAGEPD